MTNHAPSFEASAILDPVESRSQVREDEAPGRAHPRGERLIDTLLKALPSTATIVVLVLILIVARRLMSRGAAVSPTRTHLIMLGLWAAGILIVLMVLPIGDAMRGQVLSLFGILVSAAIALSATTFVANAMAGVMLRAVRNFRSGDFVRCGDHFGRVSERGLFHIEIQNEDRDLITLPNLYLVTNPVTTVRSSGTIVSATVSLGYDVHRKQIEACLLEAAEQTGLTDPFVQVSGLGDFSVVYRIAGLLTEVKQLLSTRSRLRGAVLDSLHEAGIEIVSPNFVNSRPLADGTVHIPRNSTSSKTTDESGADSPSPEDLVFDKAEEAESLEELQAHHKELAERIQAMKSKLSEIKGAEREEAERTMEALFQRRERLEALIRVRQAKSDKPNATDTP